VKKKEKGYILESVEQPKNLLLNIREKK